MVVSQSPFEPVVKYIKTAKHWRVDYTYNVNAYPEKSYVRQYRQFHTEKVYIPGILGPDVLVNWMGELSWNKDWPHEDFIYRAETRLGAYFNPERANSITYSKSVVDSGLFTPWRFGRITYLPPNPEGYDEYTWEDWRFVGTLPAFDGEPAEESDIEPLYKIFVTTNQAEENNLETTIADWWSDYQQTKVGTNWQKSAPYEVDPNTLEPI